MITLTLQGRPVAPAPSRPLVPASSRPVAWLDTLAREWTLWRARRVMASLGDKTLHDLGIAGGRSKRWCATDAGPEPGRTRWQPAR